MAWGGGSRDGETVGTDQSRSRQEDQYNEWKNGDGDVSTKCVCIVDCACTRTCGFTYNPDRTCSCAHECVCADVPIWTDHTRQSVTSRGEAHPGDAAGGSGGAFGRVFVSDSVAGGGKMVTPRRSDAATAVQYTPPISPDQEWCDVVSKRNRREKKKHAREPEVTTRSECVKKEEDDSMMRRGAETKDGYTFSPPVSEKMLSNQAHNEVSSDFVSQTVSTRWVDRVTGQSDAPRPERMQSRSGGGSSSYGDRSSMEKEKSTEEGSTDSCLEDPESERYKTSGCDLEVSNAGRDDRRSEHGFNAL